MSATIVKNLRDGTLTISDDGGNSLVVALEEGDLSIELPRRTVAVIKDRGALQGIRKVEDEPIGFSMTLKFTEFIKQTGAASPSPYEALTLSGAAAGWTSTQAGSSDVGTVDLKFEILSPKASDSDERITLENAWCDSITFTEGAEYNTLAVQGRCLATDPIFAKF